MLPNCALFSEHQGKETAAQPVSFSLSLLALLVTLQSIGAFTAISQIGRFFLWFIWVLMWSLILMNGFSLRQIPGKAKLFLGWLFLYCAWGLLVSPFPDWSLAMRGLFYAFTAAASLTILSRDFSSWKQLSVLSGWVLIMNLVVALAFINISDVRNWMIFYNIASAKFQISINRFSGLMANPNEAGMQTILLMTLTLWSSGVLMWVSRGAGVWLIYLTASRSSTYCLLIVAGLYLLYSVRHTRQGRLASVALIFLVFLGMFLEIDPLSWFHRYETGSLFWKRILDPIEQQSRTYTPRLSVVKLWLRYLDHAPWYGFGLNAMTGSATSIRTDIPSIGTHNMMLGIWADAGVLGLLSYLVILAVGVVSAIRAKLNPLDRTVLLCMWATLLTFNMFKDSLHLSIHAVAFYLMVFMFPDLPIFRTQVITTTSSDPSPPVI